MVLFRHEKRDVHRKSFAGIHFAFINVDCEKSIVCDFYKFRDLVISSKELCKWIEGISSAGGTCSSIGDGNSFSRRSSCLAIDEYRKFRQGKLAFSGGLVVLDDAVGATHLPIDDIHRGGLGDALFLKSCDFRELVVGLYFLVC